MNIKKTSTTIKTITDIQGKKLCPLSSYQGQFLKLTKIDKERISKCEAQLSQLRCDLYQLNKKINPRMQTTEYDYWMSKIMRCECKIDALKNLIRNIKINRFNIQKTKDK